MDLIQYLLFENPASLWVVLGVAAVCLAVAWRRSRDRRLLVALLAMPAAALVLAALDAAVETDYERILRTLATMRRAVAEGDAETFIERISPDYRNGRFTKEDLARVVWRGMLQVRARGALPRIDRQPGKVTVIQAYHFEPAPGSRTALPPSHQTVEWEGVFAPDADGEWRLRRATALKPVRMTPEEAVRYLPAPAPGE